MIDATGLVLAPGFIDAHNHSTDGLDNDPDAVTQVSQGITTVLLGQDGSSPFPVRDYLAQAARDAGDAERRAAGRPRDDSPAGDGRRLQARRPPPREIARMEALVDQEMRDGAIGLSSGLEYEVGSYASTEEVVSLARVAARHRGFYISHIRDEADARSKRCARRLRSARRPGCRCRSRTSSWAPSACGARRRRSSR